MGHVKPALCLVLVTLGCTAFFVGTEYTYDFELTSPAPSFPMAFEDDAVRIRFMISEKSIDFTLTNKTSNVMRILWDEASIVQYGKAHKVIHQGVRYVDRYESQLPTSVPPRSSIDDFVLPTDNVYWREGRRTEYSSTPGGWEEHELFPVYDLNDESIRQAILSTEGQKIALYLPIEHRGNTLEYFFEFTVRTVSPATGSLLSSSRED